MAKKVPAKPPAPGLDLAAAIARATEHANGRDWHGALRAILPAWVARRTPALAALVEALSDRAEQGAARVPGATLKARLAAGQALIAAPDPRDLPRVMRLLPDVAIKDAVILARGLVAYLPDPRYLRHVLELLRAAPWGASTSRTLWRVLLANLASHPDPRTRTALAAFDFMLVERWQRQVMEGHVAKLLAKLSDDPAPGDDDLPGIAALADQLTRADADGTDLLAAIYANPDDDAPRAIYADWLGEREDPRGELITLQLAADPTAEQRRRARALIELHADGWLAPIAPALLGAAYRRFARGFLASALVKAATGEALREAREWATLEELWLYEAHVLPRALIDAPALRALRFVGGLQPMHVHDLERVARSLTGLGFGLPRYGQGFDANDRAVISRIALPAVRELAFATTGAEALAWLWDAPIGSQLARLRVDGIANVPGFIADARIPAHLTSVQVATDHNGHGWMIELARGADGRLSRLVATLRPGGLSYTTVHARDIIEHVLDELAPDALEAFALTLDGTAATRADLQAIAAALGRQTRLASARLPGDVAIARVAASTKTVKTARAEAAAAASEIARAAYVSALTALPERVGYLEALDYGDPNRCADAEGYLEQIAARPLPDDGGALAGVLFALLELPTPGVTASAPARRVQAGAVRVLSQLAPAGAFARIAKIFERNSPYALGLDLCAIPAAELPQLFDWFETRRGEKAPPPAHAICYGVRAVAILRGTAATRADLERRLAAKMQLRFVQWAYTEAIRGLAGRE